jgi:hypothetical protein
MRHKTSSKVARYLAGGVIAFAVSSLGSLAFADFVPGGGNQASDCYMGFDVTGVTASGGKIECTEGDPCDTGACGDNKCDFQFTICVNRAGVQGCTPPAGGLSKVDTPGPFRSGIPPSPLTGAACGTPLSLELKLKDNGQRKNKRAIRPKATAVSGIQPRKDQDQFLFVCKPRSGACPPASPSGAFLR